MPRFKEVLGRSPPKGDVSSAERALQRAQVNLDRANKIQEQAEREVQRQMEMLARLQEDGEKLVSAFTARPTAKPSLSASTPTAFQSQYNKFRSPGANLRLKPAGQPINTPTRDTSSKKDIEVPGRVPMPDNTQPSYSFATRSSAWQRLEGQPGVPVYVTGDYEDFDAKKQYEYIMPVDGPYPIEVGQTIQVPIHYGGHNGKHGKSKGRVVSFTIRSIHASKQYGGDEDEVGTDVNGNLI